MQRSMYFRCIVQDEHKATKYETNPHIFYAQIQIKRVISSIYNTSKNLNRIFWTKAGPTITNGVGIDSFKMQKNWLNEIQVVLHTDKIMNNEMGILDKFVSNIKYLFLRWTPGIPASTKINKNKLLSLGPETSATSSAASKLLAQ